MASFTEYPISGTQLRITMMIKTIAKAKVKNEIHKFLSDAVIPANSSKSLMRSVRKQKSAKLVPIATILKVDKTVLHTPMPDADIGTGRCASNRLYASNRSSM